jgi:hypothetical protein
MMRSSCGSVHQICPEELERNLHLVRGFAFRVVFEASRAFLLQCGQRKITVSVILVNKKDKLSFWKGQLTVLRAAKFDA